MVEKWARKEASKLFGNPDIYIYIILGNLHLNVLMKSVKFFCGLFNQFVLLKLLDSAQHAQIVGQSIETDLKL